MLTQGKCSSVQDRGFSVCRVILQHCANQANVSYMSDVVVSLAHIFLIAQNHWSHITYERNGERNLFSCLSFFCKEHVIVTSHSAGRLRQCEETSRRRGNWWASIFPLLAWVLSSLTTHPSHPSLSLSLSLFNFLPSPLTPNIFISHSLHQ